MKVDRKASNEAIKRSFRHLAHRYHPDKNPGNPFVSDYFLEIQEAYHVLSRPLSRKSYDRQRSLRGEPANSRPVVTVAYIRERVAQLMRQIAQGNGLNVNQTLLCSYLDYLLSPEHIAILIREGKESTITSLFSDIIRICRLLKPDRFSGLQQVLETLAGDHPERKALLDQLKIRKKRQLLLQRIVPFLVVLLTLLICLWMYWYAA